MFTFVDIVLQKRRFIIAGASVLAVDLLFIALLGPMLQAHHASIAARIQTPYTSQDTYESPNTITNALGLIGDDAKRAAHTMDTKLLSGTMAITSSIVRFNKDVARDTTATVTFLAHGVTIGVLTTVHAISTTIGFVGHTISSVFRSAFDLFHGVTHIGSVIRPQDHTPVPLISQLRIQQAAIIQSGTVDVAITSSGIGGACDSGGGNGHYPLNWCSAPMDSIATISYSSDPINRECTSYAYWYFTAIEGHTDFQPSGNAKNWAASSNYPTGRKPIVGAIAVETAGAYGHVAIVQALPGQTFGGQVVPAGYILVSEMNYDWNGHFRYSYSPLSKFSAYVYP